MKMEIVNLRTENLENPQGTDARHPRFSWQILSDGRGVRQTSYHIICMSEGKVIWDSGAVVSGQSRNVRYEGASLTSRMSVIWSVEVTAEDEAGSRMSQKSAQAEFSMGLLNDSDWKACWITAEGDEVSGKKLIERLPAVYLRRTFTVKPGLVSAKVYQTAHGLYHFWMNGKSGTEDLFKPGLTSYYYRIQYQVYDVTSLLKAGENCWAVELADGWWRGTTGGTIICNYGRKLAFLGQLELNYDDGTTEVVASDDSFRTGRGGLRASDMMMGDVYDASKEPENWRLPDFDDSGWKTALIPDGADHFRGADADRISAEVREKGIDSVDYYGAELIASRSVPVRAKESFAGKAFRDPAGHLVIDFGQNIAGRVRMTLRKTSQGQRVHLIHGETLDHNGNFTTMNVNKTALPVDAFQEVTYLCRGAEEESYVPEFSIFGFRYVCVEGYEGEIREGDFTAQAIYSDMRESGTFTCSNELINKLVDNCRWSQKGNFMDVPVDCPTRERNAWTGDAQVYVRTAADFMDVYSFYEKWLYDQRLEQYQSGKVGITFPATSSVHDPRQLGRMQEQSSSAAIAGPAGEGNIGEDSTGWGDAAVWLPWVMYQCYGDETILRQQYDIARKWVDFELQTAQEMNPLYADTPAYHHSEDGESDGSYLLDLRFQYGEWNEAFGISAQPSEEELQKSQAALDEGQKVWDNAHSVSSSAESGEDTDDSAGMSEREKEAAAAKKAGQERVNMYLQMLAKKGNAVVATAYMYRSADCVAKMAEILGKGEDAAKYRRIADRIRRVYSEYLIADDGVIEAGHQAPYVRALAMGVCSEEKKPLVEAQLIKEIRGNDYRLNTGFLSTPFLLPVLCDMGEVETAYRILEQTKRPGWLYPVLRGMTTIPESWAGVDTLVDSLNHYSYGAVSEFLFGYTAGIRIDEDHPGYAEFELHPVPGGTLTAASAAFESPYGMIRSAWQRQGHDFCYQCDVPVNTTAHITLPDGSRYTVGSGHYEYRVTL